jgi:hypothetical protein
LSKSKLSRARARISGRYAIATALVVVLGIPSLAIAFGEGNPVRGGKRNPSPNASRAYSAETEIIASNTTYGTRQSNKRDGDGGGAIYGCRSNPGNESCVRASNLKGGQAFSFATVGKTAGRIDVGDRTGAPFTTNATGVATGLNADKVDGKEAAEFAATSDLLFAIVPASGATATGRGEPSVTRAGNVYTLTFNRPVNACSFTASPVGSATTEAPGVAPVASNANQLTVDTGPAPSAFHLQVIC